MSHGFQFPWGMAFLDPGRWLTLVGSSYTEAEVKPGIYWGKNVVDGGVDTGAKKLLWLVLHRSLLDNFWELRLAISLKLVGHSKGLHCACFQWLSTFTWLVCLRMGGS